MVKPIKEATHSRRQIKRKNKYKEKNKLKQIINPKSKRINFEKIPRQKWGSIDGRERDSAKTAPVSSSYNG